MTPRRPSLPAKSRAQPPLKLMTEYVRRTVRTCCWSNCWKGFPVVQSPASAWCGRMVQSRSGGTVMFTSPA